MALYYDMVFITLDEIVAIIGMSVFAGLIFQGIFKRSKPQDYDPLKQIKKKFDMGDFVFAAKVVAPAIVFHELAHKIAAVSFGATATLNAPWGMYLFVLVLRLINFPIIFFIGGYVSIIGKLTPIQSAVVSVSGPLVNLFLWIVPLWILKNKMIKKRAWIEILAYTSKINMFLFIFNMLPIPGFDGFSFFRGLLGGV